MTDALYDQIRSSATSWTLAGDQSVLTLLQQTADKLTAKSEDVTKEIDELMIHTDSILCRLNNVTNRLFLLSHSRFIENRVVEEADPVLNKTEDDDTEKIEKDLNKVSDASEAIEIGIRFFKENYEKIEFDDDEEYEGDLLESIYEAKNKYTVRNLPYIIGSDKFMEEDNIGLDIPGSPSTEDVESLYSEHEESESVQSEKSLPNEIERPLTSTAKTVSPSPIDFKDLLSSKIAERRVDSPIHSHKSISSSSSSFHLPITSSSKTLLFGSDSNDELFDSHHGASKLPPLPSSSSSSSMRRDTIPKNKPSIFDDSESDDEDDLFAPKRPVFLKSSSLFNSDDGGEEEEEDGDSLFSSKSTNLLSKRSIIGGVPVFGQSMTTTTTTTTSTTTTTTKTKTKTGIKTNKNSSNKIDFKTEKKMEEKITEENASTVSKIVKEESKLNNSRLFDTSSDEDNLFQLPPKKKDDKKVEKKFVVSSLFSEDEDEDDLFRPIKTKTNDVVTHVDSGEDTCSCGKPVEEEEEDDDVEQEKEDKDDDDEDDEDDDDEKQVADLFSKTGLNEELLDPNKNPSASQVKLKSELLESLFQGRDEICKNPLGAISPFPGFSPQKKEVVVVDNEFGIAPTSDLLVGVTKSRPRINHKRRPPSKFMATDRKIGDEDETRPPSSLSKPSPVDADDEEEEEVCIKNPPITSFKNLFESSSDDDLFS